MSNVKLISIVAGIVLVCGLVVYMGTRPSATPTPTPPTPYSYGAIGGPDIPSEYLHWGRGFGVYEVPVRIPMTTGTTTPCAIQAPGMGSSTLVSFTADFQQASTSQVTLSQSATAYASTTQIGGRFTIATNGQEVFVASTTYSGQGTVFNPGLMSTSSNSDLEIRPQRPLSWVVLTTPGPVTLGGYPVGFCTAVFRVI